MPNLYFFFLLNHMGVAACRGSTRGATRRPASSFIGHLCSPTQAAAGERVFEVRPAPPRGWLLRRVGERLLLGLLATLSKAADVWRRSVGGAAARLVHPELWRTSVYATRQGYQTQIHSVKQCKTWGFLQVEPGTFLYGAKRVLPQFEYGTSKALYHIINNLILYTCKIIQN